MTPELTVEDLRVIHYAMNVVFNLLETNHTHRLSHGLVPAQTFKGTALAVTFEKVSRELRFRNALPDPNEIKLWGYTKGSTGATPADP